MKITIDNRNLAYSIDTYGMFTGEWADDSEREYLQDEYGLTDSERFELSFDYDHPVIVAELASRSVNIISSELIEKSGIVRSITLKATYSPRFYNYTTDWYTAEWDVDDRALEKFIMAHQGEYNNFERDNWYSVYDSHGTDDFKREEYVVAMLDFWSRQVFTEDEYNEKMWECESEVYTEHMTLDEDSQKLIDGKAVKA